MWVLKFEEAEVEPGRLTLKALYYSRQEMRGAPATLKALKIGVDGSKYMEKAKSA